MSVQSILFRINANEESGMGHFTRSLNLARAIMEIAPKVLINLFGDFNPLAQQMMKKYDIPFVHKLQASFEPVPVLNAAVDFDAIYTDSYLYDQFYIDLIAESEKVSFYVDDFRDYDYNEADQVINFTVNAENMEYGSNTNLGLGYFFARPEMIAVRKKRLGKRPKSVKSVLILLSGNNSNDYIEEVIIDPLQKSLNDVKIQIVSPSFEDRELKNGNTLTALPRRIAIEDYYAKADLLICSGGLTKYEAAFCALPNASIAYNEGQQAESVFFDANKLTVDLGMLDEKAAIKKKIAAFVKDLDLHKQMIAASKELFDSDSVYKAARSLLEH